MQIRFDSEKMLAFEKLSGDSNPLHSQALYAHKTQFGERVVFGMASVVAALGAWARGRSFSLIEIRGDFKKPLFMDTDYTLAIQEKETDTAEPKVQISYLRGDTVQSKFSFRWKSAPTQGPWPQESRPAGDHLKSFSQPFSLESYAYSLNTSELKPFLKLYQLAEGQLPLSQLSAILWSSFFVGMRFPGEQALFTQFDFQFKNTESMKSEIHFEKLTGQLDERFNLVQILAEGTGATCKISALRRPPPVSYDIGEIRKAQTDLPRLSGKCVFLSGGSRGFGSVLTRMMALQGARVYFTYLNAESEAWHLCEELKAMEAVAIPLRADLSKPQDVQLVLEKLKAENVELDFIVNNASPLIGAVSFRERSAQEFIQFVTRSIALTVLPVHALLPILKAGGFCVDVSSVFTTHPVPQFSHYIAAKSALEGFLRALALEFKNRHFVNFRAPRMLTDQTNLAFHAVPPASAIEVSHFLLKSIFALDMSQNYHEISGEPVHE